VRALVFGFVVVLSFSATTLAASSTTNPGRAVLVHVKITDKGIKTYFWGIANAGGDQTYVVQTYVSRGQIAYFTVQNLGKKPHDYVVLGKKTPKLSPGAKARFHVSLVRRGNFPYQSTLDKGKAFRGVFTVN
jgi:hypothetical protein